jgi:uncharacterized protein YqcC (DUF446 family)
MKPLYMTTIYVFSEGKFDDFESKEAKWLDTMQQRNALSASLIDKVSSAVRKNQALCVKIDCEYDIFPFDDHAFSSDEEEFFESKYSKKEEKEQW